LSPDLLRQYKKQQLFELKVLYGVESLDPEISEISNHQVGQLIDTLLPIDICRRYRLVPLSKKETQPPSVLVAMVDPDNLDAQDDLTRILRPQGIALQRMVITQEDYQQLISKYLDEKLAKQKQMEVEKAVDIKQDLENLDNLDS
jgi:type IV pilus assembly protein PilB